MTSTDRVATGYVKQRWAHRGRCSPPIPCVCLRAWAANSAQFRPAGAVLARTARSWHGKLAPFWRRPISTPLSNAERIRFRNLLELANSSEFAGERDNALAAAQRIAQRHGLTLEEAARMGLESKAAPPPQVDLEAAARQRAMRFAQAQQEAMAREKQRWEEAVRRARARGLDSANQAPSRADSRPRRWSRTRRDPTKHAAVLLEETSLPFHEIASITGLDIYSVVGMKLKMRAGALT